MPRGKKLLRLHVRTTEAGSGIEVRKTDQIAFQFGSKSALRATNELVDQLQEQLRRERAQHAFNMAEKQKELTAVLRELTEVRLELARRDRMAAFAAASCPSAMMH